MPLLENNYTNYLVIEYKGSEGKRFHYLVQHLFKMLNITEYHVYVGYAETQLIVFIEVPKYTLEEAEQDLSVISLALKEKMIKNWKCLPSSSLPEEYNIVTLPYKKYIP